MSRFVLAAWFLAGSVSILGCGDPEMHEPTELFQQIRVGMNPGEADEVIQRRRRAKWLVLPEQYETGVLKKPFRVEKTTEDGKVREVRQYRTWVKRHNILGTLAVTEGRLVELVFVDDLLASWRTRDRPFVRPEEPAKSDR